MKQPTPMKLLTDKLKELEKARDKSIESYQKEEITEGEHQEHMENLTSQIEDYRYTIRVINQYK